MQERVQNKIITDPPFLQMFQKKASLRTRIPKIGRAECGPRGPRRPLRAKEFESGSAKLPKLSFAWKNSLEYIFMISY